MNLLYALEHLRTPFWDAVFSAVTHLGEETVFMVAAILKISAAAFIWAPNAPPRRFLPAGLSDATTLAKE